MDEWVEELREQGGYRMEVEVHSAAEIGKLQRDRNNEVYASMPDYLP
jgi:hypothetical protein